MICVYKLLFFKKSILFFLSVCDISLVRIFVLVKFFFSFEGSARNRRIFFSTAHSLFDRNKSSWNGNTVLIRRVRAALFWKHLISNPCSLTTHRDRILYILNVGFYVFLSLIV